jgi:hypothetical protein
MLRIERSIKGQSGIWPVYRDVNSKIAPVKYDGSKVNIEKIEIAASQAGHDTGIFLSSK